MIKNSVFILTSILVLALLLRLPLLNGSFWLDEAAQALESARPWSEQLELTPDFQPPLLHLLTAVFIRINTAEWWLRWWGAVLPGLFTIWLVYQLGYKLNQSENLGKLTGGVSALLLATSSFHIFYSQELRPYSLPTLWAVLSWFLLLTKKQRLFENKFNTNWWKIGFSWALVSILGLYTSYLYPFVLLGQLGFIGFNLLGLSEKKQVGWAELRQSASRWLALFLMIILGFLPWLPSFMAQFQAGQFLRAELPGWESVVSTPQLKALLLTPAKFVFGVSDLSLTPYFILTSIMLGIFLSISIYFWWKKVLFSSRFAANKQFVLQITVFWLLIPFLSAWLISFFVPVIQPKRILFLLPGFYLIIAMILSPLLMQAKTAWQQHQFFSKNLVPAFFFCLLFFLNLTSTIAYWRTPALQRENWRSLWLEIDQKYSDRTPKLFVFSAPFASWVWYDQQLSKFSLVNDFSLTNQNAAGAELAKFLVNNASQNYTATKLIYFDYMTDLTDPNSLVKAELSQHGYLPTDLLDYPQIGYIRVFEKTEINE